MPTPCLPHQVQSACAKRKGREIVQGITKLQEVCGKEDDDAEVREFDDSKIFSSLGQYLCDKLTDSSGTALIVHIFDALQALLVLPDYAFPSRVMLVESFTEACLRLGAHADGETTVRRDAIMLLTEAMKNAQQNEKKKNQGSILLDRNEAQLQDLVRGLDEMPCYQLQSNVLELLYILLQTKVGESCVTSSRSQPASHEALAPRS